MDFERFSSACKKRFQIKETEEILIQYYHPLWKEYTDISEIPRTACKLKIVIKRPKNNSETEASTSDTQENSTAEAVSSPEKPSQPIKSRYFIHNEVL